jgi:arsenical pump membrane protein
MAVLSFVLLGAGIAGVLARPLRLPPWSIPLAAVAAALGLRVVSPQRAALALGPLAQALGFLLAAVPLAILLDRVGFFESLSRILAGNGMPHNRRPGPDAPSDTAAPATRRRPAGGTATRRHTVAGLWILAALVTTVLNLDASVVLLTPLYVRVARRTGMAPLALAFQPVLLATLASSALSVSNLTNLIAAGRTGATPVQFLAHLGAPSLAATFVGYWCYRWAVRPGRPEVPEPAAPERRPLVVGGAVVLGVLAGFVAGPSFGVAPWMVALGADVVLVGLTRSLPLRTIPWGTAIVAAALAVLAYAVTAHLPVARYLAGTSLLAQARTVGLSALAANAANNLPTLLVAVQALPPHPTCQLWPVLIGVNIGPTVLATGTLATLLWLESVTRLDVDASPLDYARVGAQVGIPALAVATAVLLGLAPLLGCR